MEKTLKKVFELYSRDKKTNEILNNLKKNKKLYLKFKQAFELLGDFDGIIETNIYEVIDNKKKKGIRLSCEDNSDNIFVFYATSTNSEDLSIIDKETNDGLLRYDLSFSKKFDLNSENIELTRSYKTYNFKFGRLVTDENSFYSIFIGDNIAYQIQINYSDENKILKDELLNKLNSFDNKITFIEFINIFDILIKQKNITYNSITLSAYKDFERIGNVELKNDEIDKQKRKIK